LNEIKPEKANEIFDLLEKFAGYGFNRSHSAAYAWVSYQTAFLKANYPVEFMAAVMSNEVSNTDKISVFVAECERMGISILAPDVNKSGLKFTPEEVSDAGVEAAKAARRVKAAADPEATEEEEGVRFDDLAPAKAADSEEESVSEAALELRDIHVGSIRFGLAAIKNVGEAAMEAAIAERTAAGPFKSLEDFCGRVDLKKVNKKALECLVKCGAFDWTGVERAQLASEIDGALAAASSAHRDRAAGQFSMFDAFETSAAPASKKNAASVLPWSSAEKLAFEKELLGFYVTGHPLDDYRPMLESGKYVPIGKLADEEDKSTVTIAGALTSVEQKFTKKDNKPFAVVVLEDLTASLEVMIWNETFTKSRAHLVQGAVVSITGRLDKREEAPRVVANEVKPLKKPAPPEKPVVLSFDSRSTTEQDLLAVRDIVQQFPGNRRLEFRFFDGEGNRLRMLAGIEFRVALNAETEKKFAPWMKS
jgi:DNA polymerase-3 subunit alpha